MSAKSLLARSRAMQLEAADKARQALDAGPPESSRHESPTPCSGETSLHAMSNPFASPTVFSSPAATVLGPAQMAAFADRQLKRIKLDEDSQGELRRFHETVNAQERELMQFMHTLHLKQLVSKSLEDKITVWKPSPNLAKLCRPFIWTLLLLPNIKMYTGNLREILMATTRKHKVKELPSIDNTWECDGIMAWFGRECSLKLSDIKTKIISMTDDAQTQNVADITNELIKRAPYLRATAGLYTRIAFIRLHITDYNHSANEFWGNVDVGLKELGEAGEENLIFALHLNYTDNIKKYGDPAISQYCTGTPVGDSDPSWVQTLHSLAPTIVHKANKKRARKIFEDSEADTETGAGADGQGEDMLGGQVTEFGLETAGDEVA